MKRITPHKSLGQHFLKDTQVLDRIVAALAQSYDGQQQVLEIGPGMGALTERLIPICGEDLRCIELDNRCVTYLGEHFPVLENRIISGDFLNIDLGALLQQPTIVIGNFPYNISSQIIWRIIDHHEMVPTVIGMFQKEVAQRLVAGHGSKLYGIQSVITACFYSGEMLFEIPPTAFSPPPKVMSAVIRLQHHPVLPYEVNIGKLKQVVKQAFNQRRKMLRNSLSGLLPTAILGDVEYEKRPEQLSLADFVKITAMID